MSNSESISVALCLLTWNEIEGCKVDLPQIDMKKFDQVYAVDGGSSDGTVKYMEECGVEVIIQPTKGYNQAYFRNEMNRLEKMKNDKFYSDNISFKVDLFIVLKTFSVVLRRKGLYKD